MFIHLQYYSLSKEKSKECIQRKNIKILKI